MVIHGESPRPPVVHVGPDRVEVRNWGVRPMNFGQSAPAGAREVEYRLEAEQALLDTVSRSLLAEAREDARRFRGDWGRLGEWLVGHGEDRGISLVALMTGDPSAALDFLRELAHPLLVELERGAPAALETPDWCLNTVDKVEVEGGSVRFRGRAFAVEEPGRG